MEKDNDFRDIWTKLKYDKMVRERDRLTKIVFKNMLINRTDLTSEIQEDTTKEEE